MQALREQLMNLINSAFLGFDKMCASSQDVLTNGLGSWADVLLLADILKPFCYTIIGICLLLEIAQVAMKVDIVKWEHGLKLGVKLVLAKVLIDTAPVVLEACYLQTAKWITAMASNSVSFGYTTFLKIQPLVNGISGLWAVIGLFISVFILILAIQLCGLVIQVIAYGRMFELYVYLAISPIPCAFFPLGNGDGGGFSRITGKFFKSFAAVCLQGVMMILCLRIFGVIMSSAIDKAVQGANAVTASVGVSDLCFTMLLGSVVLVMSIIKCGGWAKSILDAM